MGTVAGPVKEYRVSDFARHLLNPASIKKVLKQIDAPYVGYEMHVEYIPAHGCVEGDSASVAMDIGLISDFIKQPVKQTCCFPRPPGCRIIESVVFFLHFEDLH